MTWTRRWAHWFRALAELDRTPEEILSARLDAIEKQLREHHSNGRSNP
jgi:hypothetical protein